MNNEQAKNIARHLVADLITKGMGDGTHLCTRAARTAGLIDEDGIITPAGAKVEHYMIRIQEEMDSSAV